MSEGITEKEELWRDFTNLKTEHLVNYDRHALMRKIGNLNTSVEENKITEKELALTWLMHAITQKFENFELDKSEIDNEIEQFRLRAGNCLEYYKKRLEGVDTPLLISHYSLGCFLLGDRAKIKDVFANTLEYSAVQLQSSDEFSLMNGIRLLVIAFNLNKMYNLKEEENLYETALKAVEIVKVDPRYLIETFEIIKQIGINDEEKLDKLIDLGICSVEKIKWEDTKEKLLLKIVQLCKMSKKHDSKIAGIRLKIAEIYEESASKKDPTLSIVDLKKAITYYTKLNQTEKIKEIKTEIMKLSGIAVKNMECVETKIEMPKLPIRGETRTERVAFIANLHHMIPDMDRVKEEFENRKRENPLSELFTTIHLREQKPLESKPSMDHGLMREMILYIQVMQNCLSDAVKPLEDTQGICPEDYVDFIKNFGLHDEAALECIRTGIERHFSGDFVSSIHVLIPQIEYVLREILAQKGIPLTKSSEGYKIILLNQIIEKSSQIFDKNMINYLNVKFGDEQGMNERNDLSHGNTSDASKFNHASSLSIIYIIMRLLAVSQQKRDQV